MPKQTKPRPRQKALYGVKNWTDYDTALVQRGSITFWLSDDFEKNWLYTGEKQCGSQFEYSDKAIEIMLTVKEDEPPNRRLPAFLICHDKDCLACTRSFDLVKAWQEGKRELAKENQPKPEYRDGQYGLENLW